MLMASFTCGGCRREQTANARRRCAPRVGVATAATMALLIAFLHSAEDHSVPDDAVLSSSDTARAAAIRERFDADVQPFLKKYCLRCHNAEEMNSGIRVDQLDGALEDRRLALWKGIREQVTDEMMPPDDELQPSAEERRLLAAWIDDGLAMALAREREKNGSVRRLTVPQYRNTLRDLLRLDENLTDVLPPDSVSKDGFLNNGDALLLPPLLAESYLDIASTALDLCIVDEIDQPVIQNFRVDLGDGINPEPCPDKLILGALSRLLENDDFVVTELQPTKPFEYTPLKMQTKYRFIEGYEGNATVRGWREYDSIYHAVFACVRGTDGYPKGLAHEAIPAGLLLRPATPTSEVFGQESTYGPRANFKISLRELPEHGRFRVTVRAAKYDDGLLLESDVEPRGESAAALELHEPAESESIDVGDAGVYQIDVYLKQRAQEVVAPNVDNLAEKLLGVWELDGDVGEGSGRIGSRGEVVGEAEFVDSPFGQAVSLGKRDDAVVVPRDPAMSVAGDPFTVACWMHPRDLRQSGLISFGGHVYTHGWLFELADGHGAIRVRAVDADGMVSGEVTSRRGVIRSGQWQHVAAVVGRGDDAAVLYVNGYEVGRGTVKAADLDNTEAAMQIGRIPGSAPFMGEIDSVHLYGRALERAEVQALVEVGGELAQELPPEKPKELLLQLGDRHFSGVLDRTAFLAVRLHAGTLSVRARYMGQSAFVERIVLTPLGESDPIALLFEDFERRRPRLGVHVGLRRDCGSTLNPVGAPQTVASTELTSYVFDGAISNFPSPDVEKDNVNYLAGIREIGVRSEYTDGRDMPRLLIRSVEFEGPLYETWPPETHRSIFIETDSESAVNSAAYARDVIRSFATRAFRRPLSDAELASLFAVWQESLGEANPSDRSTQAFRQAVKDALTVVLTSPQFLFLIEESSTPQSEPIGDYELASKLSYFLWNAAPDAPLLALAAAGELRQSLDEQVERMLSDPRAHQFASEFASQWLSLDKLDVVEVDRKRFPKLTPYTKAALRDEPVHFLLHLLRHNLPLKNLIHSDFIVANEIVASYYGLADRTESGFNFVPLTHETAHLGGVLAQAGILAGLSNGRESNPVKRGAWLARKIIAEPPDDPPPNVPALPEDEGEELTLREKLERHRDQKGCANCHAGIDPWGLPFEQFDAGGLLRSDAAAVDARSVLPDETEVAGVDELKAYLTSDGMDQVAFSFLKHVATYATGRTLSYNEIELLKQKGLELKPDDYRVQDMMRFVVNSELFLEK